MTETAQWHSMGDVLDELEKIATGEDASAFLELAKTRMPDVWKENLLYALNRYLPEAVGDHKAARIRRYLALADWNAL